MSIWRAMTGVFLFALTAIAAAAASAQQQPAAVAALPAANDWKRHLERDILPFWETPAALGDPVGSCLLYTSDAADE